MTRRVVLHQEPDGGAIPDVHRGEAEEEGKLVVGSCLSVEQAGNHRDGASKARAAWPQQIAGLPYLFPLSGHLVGGENVTDVGILWPNGSRPHVARGVVKG